MNARESLVDAQGRLKERYRIWIRHGGLLILQNSKRKLSLEKLTRVGFAKNGRWSSIPPDHELMRSFYLLSALPSCQQETWKAFYWDERLAILAVPDEFLQLASGAQNCNEAPQEQWVRSFVNLTMVALATDYKKDQIHIPEILKRLR